MTRERAIETLKAIRAKRFWWFTLSATEMIAIGRAIEALEAVPAGLLQSAYRNYDEEHDLADRLALDLIKAKDTIIELQTKLEAAKGQQCKPKMRVIDGAVFDGIDAEDQTAEI